MRESRALEIPFASAHPSQGKFFHCQWIEFHPNKKQIQGQLRRQEVERIEFFHS